MAQQKILLGVTGGIAAYKTPELVRRLRDRGAAVQVVMTRSAARFVTETVLQAVSGHPVRTNLWDEQAEAAMGHIELARWADHVLIAPATAEFMARLAAGSAPDLLTTLCLATRAPLSIAPAMNHVMWDHAAVQANRECLQSRGVRILGPAEGDQACGETGLGRMVEPDAIAAALLADATLAGATVGSQPLQGRTVMVTAGPTREAIDPVRFVSNRSSGKMGYALAQAAAEAGARVVLVSGPVQRPVPQGLERIMIESAEELFAATHAHIDDVDIFIAAAAVSDYRPRRVESQKIKKTRAEMTLDFVKSPDILASVAKLASGPFTVGFAAETHKVREHALTKLAAKQLDMIIANEVGAGIGFEQDENAAHVYWRDGDQAFPLAHKSTLARALIELIAQRYNVGFGEDTAVELTALASRD
ncbi:MAG: bifunctional phosphopantothenoylcysteine decarboxylase/phosphopantothenate--cysteine ligase CoaBC [Gammaproteobacteria bacterium]|nr:bifunctional phosphopantothenoylcysteine decarboxylase/phosphopantothenate--cysteine ligase CoaBC [Gammaproteobacteria bacterium]